MKPKKEYMVPCAICGEDVDITSSTECASGWDNKPIHKMCGL